MESITFPLSVAGVSGLALLILGYIVRKGLHSQCTIPGVGSVDIDIHRVVEPAQVHIQNNEQQSHHQET